MKKLSLKMYFILKEYKSNILFKQIQNSRPDRFDCSFLDMEFISEIRRGYSSIFKYICKICII